MRFKDFLSNEKGLVNEKKETEKHAVLAFGRLSPPTTGHEVLVNKVHDIAKKNNASHHLVLSSTQDKNKNPLSPEQKLKHAKRFFPKSNISVATKEHPNFLTQAQKLHQGGATHLHMVAGSDRVDEYHKLLHKYNGTHEGALFNFKHIKVHSAGERDPDAEGTTGMSASKMRKHASEGNFSEFKKGIPKHVPDHHAKELYDHVRKGMNIKETVKLELPLDDLFENVLVEGVHDKGIFKAVFLAGGPGSGKDYVLDNTLQGHGLTEINSDKALEFLMDKKGLDKRMPASEKDVREVVRGRAKGVTELRQRLALLGRNGLIINGTGDDLEKVKKIKSRLEELGYETSMVAVNTSDEISKQRNIERGQRGGRTVPEDIRKSKWESVQNSRPELAKLFGQNYMEFDNSEDLRNASPDIVKAKKEEMLQIFKKVKEFTSTPPKSETSQTWVAKELGKKDTLPVSKKGTSQLPKKESNAYQEAQKMGLTYYGFGRYGKNGTVTHHSVHDKLVADKNINEDFQNLFEQVSLNITADNPEDIIKLLKDITIVSTDEVPDDELDIPVQDTEEDAYSLSDLGSMNLLTLGKRMDVYENTSDKVSVLLNESKTQKEVTLLDKSGKVKVFMLRRAAAEYAHQNNGVVHKGKKGYIVKLKEETNDQFSEESIQTKDCGSRSSETGRITEASGTNGTRGTKCSCEGSCACGTSETGGTKTTSGKKITIGEAKKKYKETIKEIDAGTEIGMSMASSGEAPLRGGITSTRAKNKPFDETIGAGGEMASSIGDGKELELRRQGISLTSFKTKGYAL
jgi:chloramphenicol 3-O-phosphotransferase